MPEVFSEAHGSICPSGAIALAYRYKSAILSLTTVKPLPPLSAIIAFTSDNTAGDNHVKLSSAAIMKLDNVGVFSTNFFTASCVKAADVLTVSNEKQC